MAAPPPPAPCAPELLRLRAARHPDAAPLRVGDAEPLTYADWDRRSDAVARSLRDRGVRPGARVLLRFGGLAWIDYAIAYLGVLKAAATAVHVSDQEPARELQRRIDQTGPVGVIHHGAAPALPGFSGWTATAADLAEAGQRSRQPLPDGTDPAAIADILYTSGTTGPAKPFTVPHGNLAFSLARNADAEFAADPPTLAPMPLGTTSSANIVATFALTTTGTIVVCSPDDIEQVAALIARHRAEACMLPPWAAVRLAESAAHQRYDLTSVTTIGTASAPMPAVVARRLLAMMPHAQIHTAYAQSEAVPAIVVNTFDPDRPMCLGHPGTGTQLRVVRPDGEPAGTGELGEVWLRSAAPKRLYLDEQLNGVHAGGWTRTQDLGHEDEHGRLHLFDRQVDAVHTGHGPVSSIEVEHLLYEHPEVREAAAFGVPTPDGGQLVAAAVAPRRPGADDLAAVVRAFAAERLAPHQVPATVLVAPALPRGVTGKVRKHLLRERCRSAAPGGRP